MVSDISTDEWEKLVDQELGEREKKRPNWNEAKVRCKETT